MSTETMLKSNVPLDHNAEWNAWMKLDEAIQEYRARVANTVEGKYGFNPIEWFKVDGKWAYKDHMLGYTYVFEDEGDDVIHAAITENILPQINKFLYRNYQHEVAGAKFIFSNGWHLMGDGWVAQYIVDEPTLEENFKFVGDYTKFMNWLMLAKMSDMHFGEKVKFEKV